MAESGTMSRFKAWLFAQHLNEKTVAQYLADTYHFRDFLRLSRRRIDRVGERHVREYLTYLKLRGFSPATVRRHLVSLRRYLDFLVSEQRLVRNPAAATPLFRPKSESTKTLSGGEFALLVGCLSPHSFCGLRDGALYFLIRESGAQVEEICALQWKNLEALLSGFSPSDALMQALELYHLMLAKRLGCHPKEMPPDLCVFCNRSGEGMTRQGMAKGLQANLKRACLPTHFSLTSLRRPKG